jgi:hypothetical protein
MDNELNGNDKFSIDQTLIRSINQSNLPDELKTLGISAYDENDFENGVLLQVDMHIAQRELKEVSNKSKNIKHDLSKSKNVKRRLTEDEEEQETDIYNEKRSKLQKTFQKYKKYLNEDSTNGDDKEDDEDELDLFSKELINSDKMLIDQSKKDQMIKRGEMTPFGTILNEDGHSKNSKINIKKKNKDDIMDIIDNSSNLTDFDDFLLNFDKKKVIRILFFKSSMNLNSILF